MCDKRTYTNYRLAEAAQKRMRQRLGFRGKIYLCPHCGFLHLGRDRKTKRQERRRNEP